MVSPSRWPLQVKAAGVHLLIRLLMLPAFLVAWSRQGPNRSSYPSAPPDFWTFLGLSWDGAWYHRIATNGYPATLPLDPATGAVAQNAWAFYPVFPGLVRVVMVVTRAPFEVISPVVSLAMGTAAAAVVATLVREAAPEASRLRQNLPLLAVGGMAAFPSAAVSMVGYSETTALFFIALSLLLINRRRYGWASLAVLALGFSRAVALPMAAVVLWHGLLRWKAARREGRPLERTAFVKLALLTVVAVASGFLWPAVAGVVTGVPDAYLRTQAAWRFGQEGALPFTLVARKLGEWFGPWRYPVVVGLCMAAILAALTPPARRLGAELQCWGAAYLVYLFAVADLGSSFLRFSWLSITLPLALIALPRQRWLQAALIVVVLVAQAAWIVHIWVFDGKGDHLPP